MRSVQKRPPPLSSVAASSSSARRPQSFPPTIFSPQPLLVRTLVRLVRGGPGPAQDFAPPVPHHQPNTSDFCAWLFHPKFYRGGKSPKLQELSPPVADPSVVEAPDGRRVPSLLATFCPAHHHRRLTTTTDHHQTRPDQARVPGSFSESGA